MTTRNYVTTNEYVPTLVVTDPNGRSSANPDLAFDTLLTSERNFSNLLKRHAYARLNDSSLAKSNPNFSTGVAGRLTSLVTSSTSGNPAQIVRGYIRRSNFNPSDPTDGYRLYFMFNPETIQRDYVAYLEQQALDPFNTIYGANNLVAPPGILDFQFTLLFDRQTENATGEMPRGVLEDYDYFDLVVRGVIPDGQSPQLQDNGIMMVNPRNINVVFSPQLSVQGRPYRASVSYTKFDHRMTPIRMEITLSMKVYYFGPLREDFTFASTQDTGVFEATIPYDESVIYEATYIDVQQAETTDNPSLLNNGASNAHSVLTNINNSVGGINDDVRLAALAQAETLGESTVPYTYGKRDDPPEGGFDCSGLVYWAYNKIGAVDAIGGPSAGYTRPMRDRAVEMNTVIAGGNTSVSIDQFFVENYLKPGDLLLSQDVGSDHIAFVKSVDTSAKTIDTYQSYPQAGPSSFLYKYTINGNWFSDHVNYVIRPAAAGSYTVAGNIGNLGLNLGAG